MSGVVAFEGELNSIVLEYLQFSEFSRTTVTFEKECTEKGKPLPHVDNKRNVNLKTLAIQNEMLGLFTAGRRSSFLELWNEYIPEAVLNEDPVAQKLEFYLSIYFAIYPLKYQVEDKESGMNEFKRYLETRGSALSQTTEFLPFYALPFVPNPMKHPSYKELFSDKWVPDLKVRLEKFLTLVLKSTPQPRLFELYVSLYQGEASQDVQTLTQQMMESDRKATTYQKRYNRMQRSLKSLQWLAHGQPLQTFQGTPNDYHNLIGITADLVDSLESTVQGNPVSPEYLQQICLRLFSNQVRQSVDFTRPGTAAEVLRQSVMPPQGLQHNEAVPGGIHLDFEKIKRDLGEGPPRTQGLLLQALRWKLTKSAPPERDALLTAFVQNDLLGCSHPGQHQQAMMRLLVADNEMVRQYIARLLNAFASLTDGRSYLAQNPKIMKGLMDNLRSEDRDSLTRENVLGCLQKLSLRRQLQSQMIEEDIIAWLVMVLDDNDSLSDYTLEYSVALLMNLALRTAGKKRCAQNPHQVLKVLSDLLGHENQEIIPYVNGALYSILAIPSIREEAKAMGMEEILQCFIKEGQADMNRQIEFIIKQLNSAEDPDDVESDDEDDDEDEDQDAMEADLDKNELLKPQQGELHGDRLLNTHYVGSTSPANRKKRHTDNAFNDDVLMRPVTPSQRRGADSPVVHVQPRSTRPPSGNGSRPPTRSSRGNVNRPPTRSGSRPNSALDTNREPPPVPTDSLASDKLSRVLGQDKKIAKATDAKGIKPSQKALEKTQNADIDEYSAAFSTRPRIPRTPDTGTRPTSRGSLSDGPPPPLKYSDSLPTSRPNSGGRPSSAKKTPTPPGSRGNERNGSKQSNRVKVR